MIWRACWGASPALSGSPRYEGVPVAHPPGDEAPLGRRVQQGAVDLLRDVEVIVDGAAAEFHLQNGGAVVVAHRGDGGGGDVGAVHRGFLPGRTPRGEISLDGTRCNSDTDGRGKVSR